MFPIRDTIQSRTLPVATWILISVNVILFIAEIAQGDALNEFIFAYGLVPARYSIPAVSHHFTTAQQMIPFLSFMFLHGGFWHLLGNMWFLYIFGDNVEDRLGHLRYIFFYLLCGWASGLTHLFFNLHSTTPTIGASGAIAGVMGAYFLLYPRARIITLIPILFIPYFFELPAALFLGIWLFFQFISAAIGGDVQAGGIAWWAHIGGFVFGALLLKFFTLFPERNFSKKLRTATERRGSSPFHMARPFSSLDNREILGTISVTPYEAAKGAQKLVNLPSRFGGKLLRVTIPPGMRDGDLIRLRGAGDSSRELYLRVTIHPPVH